MQIVHLLALGTVLLPRLAGATTANDICPPGADPCVLQNFLTVTPGVSTLLDFGNRAFQIASGRRLIVNDGDTLTIMARTVTLQTGAAISGPTGTRRTGATVIIVATGDIQFQRSGGSIDLEAGVAKCPISGTSLPLTPGSALSVTATLDVSGTGGASSGGCIDLAAAGNVTTSGMIAAQGAGSSDSGGSGADLQIDAGGSIE